MNTYRLASKNAVTMNSSGGKLLKWKVGNKFIKTSTIDTRHLDLTFLFESYAEVIASRIGKKLGLDCTDYKMCEVIIDDEFRTLACESKSFLNNGEHYLSIGKLIRERSLPILDYGDLSNYTKLLSRYRSIPNFERNLNQMLAFDYLILNDDRHFGNSGFIVNGNVRAAPIFDNGNSLFCHKFIGGITYTRDLQRYLKCKPFSIDFDRQIKLVDIHNILELKQLKPEYIKNVIRNLENNYELPKDRAEFMGGLIIDRLELIQGI